MKMDPSTGKNRALFERFHIDLPLLLGIFALMGFGLVIMYSASGQSLEMMDRQAMRMVLSLVVMVVLAQLSPRTYESLAPLMFVAGVVLLFGVLFFGEASKGAQRWLNLGFVRFQPSELLKLAVPLMVARYIGRQPLPPTFRTLIVALIMVCLPTILIAKQPDLGTSILIAASGIFVIFLAGISWKIIAAAAIALGGFIPILWFFLSVLCSTQNLTHLARVTTLSKVKLRLVLAVFPVKVGCTVRSHNWNFFLNDTLTLSLQ